MLASAVLLDEKSTKISFLILQINTRQGRAKWLLSIKSVEEVLRNDLEPSFLDRFEKSPRASNGNHLRYDPSEDFHVHCTITTLKPLQ